MAKMEKNIAAIYKLEVVVLSYGLQTDVMTVWKKMQPSAVRRCYAGPSVMERQRQAWPRAATAGYVLYLRRSGLLKQNTE